MYQIDIIKNGVRTTIHAPIANDLKVVAGKTKQVSNKITTFSFEILPNNPGYRIIEPFNTLIQVFNTLTQKYEFEGRILSPTDSMSDSGAISKSFICESELAYLHDSYQRYGEYHNLTVRQFLELMINQHNQEVANDPIDKTFTVGIVDVTNSTDNVYRYLTYESTFKSIEEKLISRLGGYLKIRKIGNTRYLDYLQNEGTNKNTEIRLAKNLKSMSREVDPTEIITRLVPLGQTIQSENENAAAQPRLTIASVNDGKDYIEDHIAKSEFGIITKTVNFDDVTLASNLLSKANEYLLDNNRIKTKYTVTALDLSIIGLDIDSFEVGNTYPIINPVMGINERLKVIEKTIDVINPNANALVFGDIFKTITDYQLEAIKAQSQLNNLQFIVNSQNRTLGTLKSQFENVDEAIEGIEHALGTADIPALEQAVRDLETSINDLNDAINTIPVYENATNLADGLMKKEDKAKLDLISVTSEVDLADLVARIMVLETNL